MGSGVGVYFEFQPVSAEGVARHSGGENGLLGRAGARGIRQQSDARAGDVTEHFILTVLEIEAFHSHGNHLSAGSSYRLAHYLVRTEFARAEEEAGGELAAGDR